LLKENIMAIVCLIGSARFESAFHEAETQLTQMGHVVLSKDPIALARRKAEGEFDVVEVEMFSLVHLEKIRQADVVLIINGDEDLGAHTTTPYIGESTAREIIWARIQGKVLISRQEVSGWGHLADLIDERYAIENGVGLRLMIDARNVLNKVSGMTVVNEVIHSDRLTMFHAALSVLATNGGDASKAYASSVLSIAGVDIMVDMPALMPMFQDPPATTTSATEPNSVQFARRELGMIMAKIDPSDKGAIEMQQMMTDGLIEMVATFSKQGHSGFSASYAIGALKQLLNFEPLLPLTGEDDEWNEVGEGVLQNKRCARVFMDADGMPYDIQGKVFTESTGASFTGRESKVYITFPYTPTTEYINVLDERGPNGEIIPAPAEVVTATSTEVMTFETSVLELWLDIVYTSRQLLEKNGNRVAVRDRLAKLHNKMIDAGIPTNKLAV
jgi:hypothetical protein